MNEDGVRCHTCFSVVLGYEHRVRFVFVRGERIRDGDYAVLSCGCEVLDYSIEVDYTSERQSATLMDTLRKKPVLKFDDSGPVNRKWEEQTE